MEILAGIYAVSLLQFVITPSCEKVYASATQLCKTYCETGEENDIWICEHGRATLLYKVNCLESVLCTYFFGEMEG